MEEESVTEARLRAVLVARLAGRLGIEPSALDPQERFSRYGLDSAGATGLIAELSEELGRTLSPTLIWAYPTVEELARHLAAGESAALRTAGPAGLAQARRSVDEPIAIVGMACRFPEAPDIESYWRMLCDGVDATRTVPADRWDAEAWYDPDPDRPGTINTRRGAFLDRIDEFDPLFFGISPREATEMDPQQRLMLELAWEGLEDAGIPPRSLAGTRTGVFVGVIFHDYSDLHKMSGAPVTSHTGPGTSLSIVANRVSYLLGLRGPSLSVDTACSSSLVSVLLACRSLWEGESSVALAGGVNLILTPEVAVELTKFGGLSGDGRCKAFDAGADGFARGEGGGVVVLKPLSRALADGDRIYCLIRGGAMNNDGASNGLTAPNPQAQVEVLQDAYARVGVDPGRVQYVEAHGTGTRLGDPIEARALAAVLCADRDPSRPLVLGSAKTNIAHQEGAAGIAGLIKLALAVHHRAIPPTLHFRTPNPDIPFEELRLRVQTALGPWPAPEQEAAVGGVSSFGWGGTNCHMVLEGLRDPHPPGPPLPSALPIPRERGEQGKSLELERSSSPLPGGGSADGRGAGGEGPLVFVFSGMGWQWPGMARDLLRSEPLLRARLERADRVLAPLTGWSLLAELTRGGERWGEVELVFPILISVEMALCDLWRSWGVEPDAVVGHSVGEVAAAYAAGALSFDDTLRVAVEYGRTLGKIDGRGALGVVALAPDEVRQRISVQGDRLELAGELSPVSAVVAGEPAAVDALLALVKAEGRFAARVAANAAAHTAQVEPHLPAMREALRGLAPRPPRIPLISTLTGEPLDRPMDGDYWTDNLRRPVLFSQAVGQLLATGHGLFLEVDGHPILATPLEQCFAASGARAAWLPSLRRNEDGRGTLWGSLAALQAAGHPIRSDRSDRSGRPELVPLSARTPEALRDLARAVAREAGDGSLPDLAGTAALRRSHHEHRLAAVARSRPELADRLEAFARGEAVAGLSVGRTRRGDRGGIVFAFSGQGPQWPGMGRQLFAGEPVFREVMERCDELLRPWLGEPLFDRLDRDEDALSHTELAQPAFFALQAALAALWRSWGVVPDAVIGHSVGEIAAAHVAGALTLEEGIRVACVRGRAMEPGRGKGGMVAVELPEEEARAALAGLDVSIAAVNSPAAVVIAGTPDALDEAVAALQARGITCRRLRVDYAFHSAGMEPFDREVEAGLADLRPRPVVLPMISTVTGAAVAGPDLDGSYWGRNVRQPVRFADAIGVLADRALFLEIGPHPVLAVAISQCLESATLLASLRRGRDERETMLDALGSLYTLGHPIDWTGVHPDGARLVRLPTYPFQRQRYWFEAGSSTRSARPAAKPSDQETRSMSQPSPSNRHSRIAATLQGIVGRVLRIEPKDIDIEAPFLELGADSLALVEALRGLQESFGVKLTIRQLFEQLPSIAALASFLDQTLPADPHPLDPPLPAALPFPGRGGETEKRTDAPAMERLFAMQIQAFNEGFNQLVAQQLQMLGTATPSLPAPPEPVTTAAGSWERRGVKPALAPVAKRVQTAEPAAHKALEDHGVRFGLYFFGNYAAEFRAGKYDLLLDTARFADRHGFNSIWFPERHFHPFGGLSPNPSVLAAALARETERIALRAGSVVLPLHHPVRVAEEWALVDNLSGGRIGLSYASGWHPNDFALAPEAYGRHRDLMFERAETVRRLWQGEAVRLLDGAGKEVDLRIFPLPSRRDLPVWITIVNNPDTYRAAGEMGAGVLTNLMGQTPDALAANLAIYREALAGAGHPPERGHVALLLHTFLGPDAEQAIDAARRPFYAYMESSVGLVQNALASEGAPVDFERLSREDFEYMLELAYQRYVKASALIGSPESVSPIVERLRDAGVDEVACLVDFGVDPDAVLASLPSIAALQERFRPRRHRPSMAPAEVPLTASQRDLYTVTQLGEEASLAYLEPGIVEMRGPLDVDLLRRSLQAVVDRHEALRSVVPPADAGEPVQVVLPQLLLDVPLVDVSGCPPERREEAAQGWLTAESLRVFDLTRGPLIHASLLRLGPRSRPVHRLGVFVHHIVADGLSIVILIRDVLVIYEAGRAGRRPVLPPAMRFRDYVAWLAAEGAPTPEDEAWWLSRFAGTLPVFEPPADRPRSPVRTFAGSRRGLVLDPDVHRALHQFSRGRGVTFFISLLAAYTAMLHRWTGQDDLIVGGPANRRPLEGGDRLVGHCVDLVPFRSRAEGDPTFLQHLAATRAFVLDTHEHSGYSFAHLLRALRLPHDPSRLPLINAVFSFDPGAAIPKAAGLELIERPPVITHAKFNVALHVLEAGPDLLVQVEYRTDLFEPETMDRFLERLVLLAEGAVADPSRPLGDLPLLTPAERRQVLDEWSGTAAEYPRNLPLHQLFAAVVERNPEAPALIWTGPEGEERLTYGELAARADELADRLRALGVGPEVRVVLEMERSPELVVAMLAVLKAGGAYVPIDPADPAERRAFLREDSGAAVVLPSPGGWEGDGRGAGGEGLGGGDHLACVIYTSGSTGKPKGVAILHHAIARLALNTDYIHLGPGDRIAHASSPAFDATTFEVWGALLTGAALVVISREVALAPAMLAEEVRRRGVTAMFLTTALFNEVVREAPQVARDLRWLLFGGEAVTPQRVREALAAAGPELRLVHLYGPAEGTTLATWHHVESVPEGRTVPIGGPVANTRVWLLDPLLRPVPVGTPGELCIGGDGLARGYLGRPDLTAERFVPSPFEAGERLYRTGDLARRRPERPGSPGWPDGAIEFLGRTDTQVKIRGLRIEPGEVETVLAGCPGVREAAVVVQETDGGRRLAAFVVLEAGATPQIPPDIRGFLAQRLPAWMVPAGVTVLDALPVTPGGKVDRRALALLEKAGGSSERPFEAPRNPVEEILAGAWADVLRRERIGIHDDFFALGGHSLLAGRVLSRLRGLLGAEVSLRDFFREPTVAGLARLAERARQTAAGAVPPPIVPALRAPGSDHLRLSFAQERLWLIDQLQPGSTAYNSFLPALLTGRLDAAALERALGEIRRRHEVLRTRFVATPEGPVQVIDTPGAWHLPGVDLDALPPAVRETELHRLAAAAASRPFDLARGPLFRPTLLRLGESEHALLLDLHHSVCDGWSLEEVMTAELSALYQAFSEVAAGRPSPLPELPIQYADFAQWQRQWLQGKALETQLAWWRERLGGEPPALDLPTDRPRPAVLSGRGDSETIFLPPDLLAGLAGLAQRHGATLFMVLLAGLQAVLHRWSGQDRIGIGTPVANRNRLEIEPLIGFFINTLVLAPDLAGNPSVSSLLERVRDLTLGAFDHQDLPFEKLVAVLQTRRDPSRNPLFQVLFVLQNNRPSSLDLPGLEVAVLPPGPAVVQFDLSFSAVESQGSLLLSVAWSADLFDRTTVERLLADVRRGLEGMVEDPAQTLRDLPLAFGPPERRQVASEQVEAAAAPGDEAGEAPQEGLRQRRQQVASRRRQLSPERRALLEKWVGGAPAGAAPEDEAKEAPPVSPLVPVQPIVPGEDVRPPIFLAHPANGTVNNYLALARQLGPEQPLYALQAPGLAGGEVLADLEPIAARYVEAVRTVQPHGPYRLGGWCTGGTVAFEMARKLHREGEEVDLLVLIDSHAPPAELPGPADEAILLGSFAEELATSAGKSLRAPLDDLRRIAPEERLDWLLELARQSGVLPESFDAEQAHRHWEVLRANVRAIERARLEPLPLRAVQFRAMTQPPEAQGRRALGWDLWIAGPLEIVDLPGGHEDLLRPPYLEALAREMTARLAPAVGVTPGI